MDDASTHECQASRRGHSQWQEQRASSETVGVGGQQRGVGPRDCPDDDRGRCTQDEHPCDDESLVRSADRRLELVFCWADALPLLRKLQWEFAAELRAAEAELAAARRVEIAGPDGELEVREGGAVGDGEGIGGPTPAGLEHLFELIAQRVMGHKPKAGLEQVMANLFAGGAAPFEF